MASRSEFESDLLRTVPTNAEVFLAAILEKGLLLSQMSHISNSTELNCNMK